MPRRFPFFDSQSCLSENVRHIFPFRLLLVIFDPLFLRTLSVDMSSSFPPLREQVSNVRSLSILSTAKSTSTLYVDMAFFMSVCFCSFSFFVETRTSPDNTDGPLNSRVDTYQKLEGVQVQCSVHRLHQKKKLLRPDSGDAGSPPRCHPNFSLVGPPHPVLHAVHRGQPLCFQEGRP